MKEIEMKDRLQNCMRDAHRRNILVFHGQPCHTAEVHPAANPPEEGRKNIQPSKLAALTCKMAGSPKGV